MFAAGQTYDALSTEHTENGATRRMRRGAKARHDRLFLDALNYCAVRNVTGRAPPERFGPWNRLWKRFSRLSRAGVFEAVFAMLAECSRTAGVVQMFDSAVVRAHVAAAGAKGGPRRTGSGVQEADTLPEST